MAETNKGIYYPTFAEVGEETYDGPVKMKMMAESIDPLLLSDEDKTKLDNIEAGAEVNVIESVKVNGTALTITDKAVDVPVPTKTSDLTNDSGFIDKDVNDLTNYYDKNAVDSKISSVYKYKGTVSTYADLPSTDLTVGDVYNIETADSTHGVKAGDNVAWNGTAWDVLAGTVDLSGKEDKTNKVTSIDENSTNTQYPSAKLLYDKLEEKQEQIDALVEENSTLKKQQLKGQASGSSIQLTDSAEGLEIENVVIKGAIGQKTRSGKNFLNQTASINSNSILGYETGQTSQRGGITYVRNADKTISYSGTRTNDCACIVAGHNGESGDWSYNNGYVLPAGTYKVVWENSESNNIIVAIWKYTQEGGYIGLEYSKTETNTNKSGFSTVTVDGETVILVGINAIATYPTQSGTVKIMVVPNSVTDYTYEQYGATPSPEYESQVHGVTGTNNVNVQRKNIFPFPFTDAATTRSGVTVTVDSKNQTMSASGTTTSANFTWYFFNGNLEIKETYKLSSNLTASLLKIGYIKKGETARTWTTLASTSIFNDGDVIKQIYIQPSSTGTTIAYKDIYVQLEKGSTATEHTLYEEQNTPISLGAIKLYDGDKIQISFINKAGYKKVTGASIVRKWKEYIVTGNETVSLQNSGTRIYMRESTNNFAKPLRATEQNKLYGLYCSHLVEKTANQTWGGLQGISYDFNPNTGFEGFNISINDFSTVQEYLNWFKNKYDAGTPFYIVYQLAEPETTPITDPTLLSQLETLINMKTYKQITNIETTGSDLSPVLEFQYSKDLQTVIDNMQAQILS